MLAPCLVAVTKQLEVNQYHHPHQDPLILYLVMCHKIFNSLQSYFLAKTKQ